MRGKSTLETATGLYTAAAIFALHVARVGSPALLAIALGSVIFRILTRKPLRIKLPIKIPDFALAVLLLLFIALRIAAKSDILVGFVEGLVIYQAFKWVTFDSPRDAFLLAGVSYVEVLASASATTSISFFPLFVSIALLTSIVLFLLYVHLEVNGKKGERRGRVDVPRETLTVIGGFGLVSLFITGIIFLSIPRLGIGLLGTKSSGAGNATGFSTTVTLEEPAFSASDSKVTARIVAPEETLPPLYLKAITLAIFREGTWLKRKGLHPIKPFGRRIYILSTGAPRNLVQYEVIQEPTGQQSLLLPPGSVEIRWKWGRLSADEDGNVFSAIPINSPVKFTVSTGTDTTSRLRDPGTYLDKTGTPGILKEVARNLRLSSGSLREKIDKIRNFLSQNCSYERSPDSVSLEEFIRGEKAGNCQHYATATVLLLREAGIPARFAGGYITSEFNEIGRYWMFRRKNAHAWAEAFVPGRGWTIIDTTPTGIGQERYKKISHILDWIRETWFEYVIGYDLEKQVALSREVIKSASRLKTGLRGKWKPVAGAVGGTVLLLTLLAIGRIRRKRTENGAPLGGRHPLYREIVKPIQRAGRRRGIVARPGETLREYVYRLVSRDLISPDKGMEFLRLYEECRYRHADPERIRVLKKLRREIVTGMGKNRVIPPS